MSMIQRSDSCLFFVVNTASAIMFREWKLFNSVCRSILYSMIGVSIKEMCCFTIQPVRMRGSIFTC